VRLAGTMPRATRPWPARGMRIAAWLVLAVLLVLSLVSWLVVADQGDMLPSLLRPSAVEHGDHMGMGADMEMASDVGMAMFLGMWVAMMVAMMFPAVSPKVVGYWRISERRSQGLLAPFLFVASYLVAWSAIGLVAYGAYRAMLDATDSLSPRTFEILGGAALVAAGAYQWSGAKSVCLRRCRGLFEMAFDFRRGPVGAVRMGAGHGLWCLGCCWGLMVVLFVLGLMNLVWMGVVAAVIFVEKLATRPDVVTKVVGAALVVAGAAWMVGPILTGTGAFG
jgi:predicted metal-binding membrane protein